MNTNSKPNITGGKMDLGATDFEIWKWVLTVLAGAVGGIITVVMATSRWIHQLDNITTDVAGIKRILFKESGGLNLMSEDRHTEVCHHTFAMWGKDIDRIEEKVDGVADKIDLVVSASATAKEYADEMRKMNAFMADISEKLGRGRRAS